MGNQGGVLQNNNNNNPQYTQYSPYVAPPAGQPVVMSPPKDVGAAVRSPPRMVAHQPYAWEAEEDSVSYTGSATASSSVEESVEGSSDAVGEVKDEVEQGAYPCRDFVRGVCRRGVNCRFLHVGASEEQMSERGLVCKDFRRGKCLRRHCRFLHTSKAGAKKAAEKVAEAREGATERREN